MNKDNKLIKDTMYGILLTYKNIFNFIINDSLKYDFMIDPTYDMFIFNDITLVNKQSKKDITSKVVIIGQLNKNIFTWNNSIRQYMETIFFDFVKSYNINDNTVHALLPLFGEDKIRFEDKYKEIIPYLISLIFDNNKSNVLRFKSSNTNNDFCYVFINNNIDIPKKVIDDKNILISTFNTINVILKNIILKTIKDPISSLKSLSHEKFSIKELKKNINDSVNKKASKKASKKTSKKASKKASKKTSKKASKKASKKTSKKASKKTSKKASKKASKKTSKGSIKHSKKTYKKASKKIKKLDNL
jgi:hypothetical protein